MCKSDRVKVEGSYFSPKMSKNRTRNVSLSQEEFIGNQPAGWLNTDGNKPPTAPRMSKSSVLARYTDVYLKQLVTVCHHGKKVNEQTSQTWQESNWKPDIQNCAERCHREVTCGATALDSNWRLKLENAFLILQARQCKGNFSDTNRPLLLFFLFDCVNWPLSMATCVPPHAAWTTFPQPFRGRWRGEFIWKITKRKMNNRYIYMNNRVNIEFGLSAFCLFLQSFGLIQELRTNH